MKGKGYNVILLNKDNYNRYEVFHGAGGDQLDPSSLRNYKFIAQHSLVRSSS